MSYIEIAVTVIMIFQFLFFLGCLVVFIYIYKILKKAKRITDETSKKIDTFNHLKDKFSGIFFK